MAKLGCKSILMYACLMLLVLCGPCALYLLRREVREVVNLGDSMRNTRECMLQALEEAESVEICLSPASGERVFHRFSQEDWAKLKPHLETVQCTVAPWLPRVPGRDDASVLTLLFHYPKGKEVKDFAGFPFVYGGEDVYLLPESEARKLTHWRGRRYLYYLPDADYEAFYAAIPPQLLEAARSTSASQH